MIKSITRKRNKLEMEILKAASLRDLNDKIVSTIEGYAPKPYYRYEKYNSAIELIKKKEKIAKLKAKYKNQVQTTQLMEFMSAFSETENSNVQQNNGPSFDELLMKHKTKGYYRIITSAFSQRAESRVQANRGISQMQSRENGINYKTKMNWSKISRKESNNSLKNETKAINVEVTKSNEKEIPIL